MCDTCEWEDTAQEIEEVLNDESLTFGGGFLNSVLVTIRSNQHVTHRQAEAIENTIHQRYRKLTGQTPVQRPDTPVPAPEMELSPESPIEAKYRSNSKFHKLVDAFEDSIRRNQFRPTDLADAAQFALERYKSRIKRPEQ